ncbi:hypothetical protein FRX31_017920 [Thalictrum thalictroides]|uniref:Uncharacterized protein n=1 Tax=Thalictrum thalictroides TaxID=46969 RepID=A0A7J6W7R0_THATH|nr:hypothetical protein FRX31_017920 [Thalictrum thalictroides]
MDLRYVVDVSSFFLVESSGDSEANSSDSISSMDCNIALAEDDAESCCGSSDVACMDDCNDINDQDYIELEDGHFDEDDDTCADRCGNANWTWQEIGLSGNANWTWQEIGISLLLDDTSGSMQTEQKKQPKARADVSADTMNEEEQNRLFWDNCLAL